MMHTHAASHAHTGVQTAVFVLSSAYNVLPSVCDFHKPITSALSLPAPSCAWIEVPDTSGGQSAPTDTVYFFSQEECTGYCDAMPACVVAVFNSPVCRIFSYDVTPVDDVGWTYLKKYCTPAGAFCFLFGLCR